ncbi:MAG: FecR family protein [Nitrospirota bacterium]|nr:FecR family protein [Nitrospirota bacterium]
MKIYKLVFIALILFLLPAYAYSSNPGSLRISLIQGDVQVKTEDTSEWVPASINMPLRDSDRLWVPESGRSELQLRDGTYMRLDENSSLEILTIGDDSFQFYLTTGHAYVNFRGLRDSLLQMDTPVSSIRAYDRSKFKIDVSPDGFTDISVFKGTVYAESRNGKTRVSAGKTLSVGEDFFADLSPLGSSDEWERWNRGRDRQLDEGRYSNKYLPDELDAYSYDFDKNGRWVYTTDYGYVWTPTVSVSVGWSPYRIGRWVWIGGDYVWVSYEPWGWVPYHYGRWSHIVSIGWVWVPPVRGAVYWGPGFVGWVYTPTFVAWVPLAPRELYYGYGYYGPNSVNIFNIDIHKTVIPNVYKNAFLSNAVTTIHRDTFLRGKPVDVKIKENPFLRERLSIGRPAIKPERTTFMPLIKEIPRIKQPPQPVMNIQVRNLKRERPLVKERTSSVLRPESPQKTMPIKTLKEPAGLDTRKYREKETFPQRQIQPSGKQQKSEGYTTKKIGEINKPSAEKQKGKTPESTDLRSIQKPMGKQPQKQDIYQEDKKRQIQPSGKQQKLEGYTTEGQKKAAEHYIERSKQKGAESTDLRSIQKPTGKQSQKEDILIGR